jgi:hypothetical protein
MLMFSQCFFASDGFSYTCRDYLFWYFVSGVSVV